MATTLDKAKKPVIIRLLPTYIIAHDIVEKNGKTVRENNLEIQHKIPLNSLVELNNGVRLFVVVHTRDCDGTPLYVLNCYNEQLQAEEWKGDDYLSIHMSHIKRKRAYGYGEESLKLCNK